MTLSLDSSGYSLTSWLNDTIERFGPPIQTIRVIERININLLAACISGFKEVEPPKQPSNRDICALFGQSLPRADSSTPAEGVVTLFVGIRETVFLEIAIGVEAIWLREVSGMTMNSPKISLIRKEMSTRDSLVPRCPLGCTNRYNNHLELGREVDRR